MYHALGIDPHATVYDRLGRPLPIAEEPIYALFGLDGAASRISSDDGASRSTPVRALSLVAWSAGAQPPAAPALKNPADGAEMVLVPAESFTMGSDRGHGDERPPHRVSLSSFALYKYEVTNEQYEAGLWLRVEGISGALACLLRG